MKPEEALQRATQIANDLAQKTHGAQVFEDEIIAAWGLELYHEVREEAARIRKTSWEMAKAENPEVREIDLDPPVELLLAVAIRKLFKVSLYNRGDFPQNIEE